MNILLTGYTGNLGPSIAAALPDHHIIALCRNPADAPARAHVRVIAGDLDHLPAGMAADVEMIVHGAANTGFALPLDNLRGVNVSGTLKMIEFARTCPRLRRFVHLS